MGPGPGEEAGRSITDGKTEHDRFVILEGVQIIRDDEDTGNEKEEGGGADLIEKVPRDSVVEKKAPCRGREQGSESKGSVAGREDAIARFGEKAVGGVAGQHKLEWAHEDEGKGVGVGDGCGKKIHFALAQNGPQKIRENEQGEDGDDPRTAADDGSKTIGAQDSFDIMMPGEVLEFESDAGHGGGKYEG